MKIKRMWAFWRRVQYGTGYLFLLSLISTGIYYQYIYQAPTCFDTVQNGQEIGLDCGGICTRICAFTVTPPQVLWAKSFEVVKGQYNAVAYVENKNIGAGTPSIGYSFKLYDDAGLITERSGTTVLPPNSTYPIFQGRIDTAGRIPTKTTLDLSPADLWLPSTAERSQFRTVDLKLVEADARPKLNVKMENNDLREAKDVQVVATIFDARGNALTSSATNIDFFPGRSQKDVVFTWPSPIAKTVRSCSVPTDVVMAIDLSGSMNNDGGTPPEPISSVLSAASAFAAQTRAGDRISVVTFATDAKVNLELATDSGTAVSTIKKLIIDPKEEKGNTNTGESLVQAFAELSSARHNPDARKVVVLLTDGLATAPSKEPEEYAKQKAELLKAGNVTLYTIGLGKEVNMDFLRTLSSGPNFTYAAPTTATLGSIYKTITDSICEDGAARIDVIPVVSYGFAPLK